MTVESLRMTLRGPSINVAERDEALADFVRRLVDKYLRSPGAVPADQAFSAVNVVSSFATQYPQAFGYGDPRRVGPVILGLLEQLPAAPQPAHASLLLHALRTTLLLLRASDAHAFATLGAEVVSLLADPRAGTGTSPTPCFLGFAAACSGGTAFGAQGGGADDAGGRGAAPAMLPLGGAQHAVVWSGLLRLAAAMHADAPQFLGDGGPGLWDAIRDSLELASLALADAAAPLQALETLLQQHPAPHAVRYQLLHSLLSLLCLRFREASHAPRRLGAADGVSPLGVGAPGAAGPAAGWPDGLTAGEYDELLGKCLTPLISPHLPPLLALPQLLHATPAVLKHSSSATLHAAICRLWCTLPRAVLARHVRALELFLGCPATQHRVIPCFLLALAPAPVLPAPGLAPPAHSGAAPDFGHPAPPAAARSVPPRLAAAMTGATGGAHANSARDGCMGGWEACDDGPSQASDAREMGHGQEASPRAKRRRRSPPGERRSIGSVSDSWGGGGPPEDTGVAVRMRLLELASQVQLGLQGGGGKVSAFRRLCAIGLILLRAPAPDAAAARARERVRALLVDAFEWLRRLVLPRPDASRRAGSCPGRVHPAGEGAPGCGGQGGHANGAAGGGTDEGGGAAGWGGMRTSGRSGAGAASHGCAEPGAEAEWRVRTELLGIALGLVRGLTMPSRELQLHFGASASLPYAGPPAASPPLTHASPPRPEGPKTNCGTRDDICAARGNAGACAAGGVTSWPGGALGDAKQRGAAPPSLLPPLLAVEALHLAALPWLCGSGDAGGGAAAEAEAARRQWTLRFSPALRCEALAVLMRVCALLPAEAAQEGAVLCARSLRTVLVDAALSVDAAVSVDPAELQAARTPVLEGGGPDISSEPAGEARVLCAALQALPALAVQHGLAPLAGCIDAALGFLRALVDAGGPQRPHAAVALVDSLGRLACVHAGCCRALDVHGWGDVVPRCSVCDKEGREGRAGHAECDAAGALDGEEHAATQGRRAGGGRGQRKGGPGSGAVLSLAGVPSPAGRCGAAAAGGVGDPRVSSRLYAGLSLLWSLLCALPAGNSGVRAAVVLCIGRLGRHAPPAVLARHVEVMQSVVGLLADPSPDVSSACAAVVPRLFGYAAFVRVVGLHLTPRDGTADEAGQSGGGEAGGGWEAPLDGRTLHDLVLSPMVALLNGSPEPPATQFRLALMTALGALGREPLYADSACRGAVVLALSSHLHHDELSREYSTAMRELRALAEAAESEDGSEPTTEALCRSLLPELAPEWVWWMVEAPEWLAPTAARLLDASVTEMVSMLIPHALPAIVLVGGLGLRGVFPNGERGRRAMRLLELLAEQLGLVSHPHARRLRRLPEEDRGKKFTPPAFTVSHRSQPPAQHPSPASRRQRTPPIGTWERKTHTSRIPPHPPRPFPCRHYLQTRAELLIHHMHLILAELFVQQAADDTGTLNDAIPGGLELVAACGVSSPSLSDLIQMCAEQLLQEMVLRLGRATAAGETQVSGGGGCMRTGAHARKARRFTHA